MVPDLRAGSSWQPPAGAQRRAVQWMCAINIHQYLCQHLLSVWKSPPLSLQGLIPLLLFPEGSSYVSYPPMSHGLKQVAHSKYVLNNENRAAMPMPFCCFFNLIFY
jgi:hypothetical protein